MNRYMIIVVSAGKKDSGNIDADKVDKGKTSKTFTVGLSPTGKEPISHHWCCWWVTDEEAAKLEKDFDPTKTNKNESVIFDPSKKGPGQILNDLGLKTLEGEVLTTGHI